MEKNISTPATESEFEARPKDAISVNESEIEESGFSFFKYLLAGILFGIMLVKGEVVSWFRIQEMFQLKSFHMYGIIGSAIVVGIISVILIKKFNIKTLHGESVAFNPKKFNKGQIFGGLIFGLGWAMTGACPGPIFAQIGSGALVITITLFSAITGTWFYGYFREKLPH